MNLNRILGIGLLVVGILLLWFGLRATDSTSETVREGLTGRFSDKTTWYLVGGALLTIVGGGLALVGPRPRSA